MAPQGAGGIDAYRPFCIGGGPRGPDPLDGLVDGAELQVWI